MHDLNKHLVQLADRCDLEGKKACANAIDDLIASDSLTKISQYVGVIGYVLKQNRAMANCVRRKRAASDTQPMQTIVLECLKEYQTGQDYQDTEWSSKYAQTVNSDPSKFSIAHLEIINRLGSMMNIEEHVDQLHKVASVLQTDGVADDVISQTVDEITRLGDFLREETTSLPFRVAAPPSPRSRWSRFWSPSEYKWWNPMSWGSRRQRGEDQDTMIEMDGVLQSIRNITHVTQQMKTTISRLKNQVAGYFAGSSVDLPTSDREDVSTIQTVVSKINALSTDNWNKNLLSLQQLMYLLSEVHVKNPYNAQHIELAKNLTAELNGNIDSVYEDIKTIQNSMNNLRQRAPIKGRDVGLNTKGEPNPFGMPSPAEEFGVLERVLSKVYQNPFDDEAHYYAQKMHARLDDRLRYIRQPNDESMDTWTKEYPPPPQAELPPSEPINAPSNNTPPSGNPSDSGSPVSTGMPQNIDEQAQSILSPTQGPLATLKNKATSQEFAEAIAELLTMLNNMNPNSDISNRIQELKNKLLSGTPQPKTNAPTLTPTTQPAPESSPNTSTPRTQTSVPTEQPKPETQNAPKKERQPIGKPKQRPKAQDLLKMLPAEFLQTGEMRQSSVFDLIRIADVVGAYDDELAKLIDDYIEEQDTLVTPLPAFPVFTKLITQG